VAREVCVITGVGPGTGAALVRRFAREYDVAMIARNEDRLRALESEVPNSHVYPCDVADPEALARSVTAVQQTLGHPSVLIHNAVSGAFGDILEIDPNAFEQCLQINTVALLHLVQAFGPHMVEAGKGTIIATGNTAAYRGSATFAGFAPSKAAQRILLESAARSLGPKGIHVAYLAIDAVIDVPWTRKRFADQPDAFFARPSDIADECFHLAHQPRSTWSFDVVIRPFGEKW
jgi:short-subunit dehydrogenase